MASLSVLKNAQRAFSSNRPPRPVHIAEFVPAIVGLLIDGITLCKPAQHYIPLITSQIALGEALCPKASELPYQPPSFSRHY